MNQSNDDTHADTIDVMIFLPDGLSRRGEAKRSSVQNVDQAISNLERGVVAWVQLGADAQAIEDWLAGGPR